GPRRSATRSHGARRKPTRRIGDDNRTTNPGDRDLRSRANPTSEAARGPGLADSFHDRVDDREALTEVRVRIHRRPDLSFRQEFRHLPLAEPRIPPVDLLGLRL